jgi:L-amino acid N-acyltransferase YncA
MIGVIRRIRAAGGLDEGIDEAALAHMALAISVGMAMIDRMVPGPGGPEWDALMARVGAAVAPSEMLLVPEHESRAPWRLRIDVPDQPGGVARLVRSLATLHTYTISVSVIGSGDGTRTVDVALTAPEGVGRAALLAAARSVGSGAYITPGTPEDSMDLPTRVLDSATAVVANPGWAPFAAARLVEADHVEVLAAATGEDDRAGVLRLQWTPDRHVLLRRDWAPFARAEQTRASALLRLSAAIAAASGATDAQGWVDPIRSGTVWIRLAYPEDAREVAAMHRRCSPRTLYLRYVSSGDWREIQMRRLAGGHSGATLVALGDGGSVIGLGNVFPERAGERGAAEIALLIDDAHQGRGIGTALLRRQVQMAARLGFTEVVAVVLAENTGMLRLLEATDLAWHSSVDSGTITLRAALPRQP